MLVLGLGTDPAQFELKFLILGVIVTGIDATCRYEPSFSNNDDGDDTTYMRVMALTASRTVMFSKSSFSISVLATDLPLPAAQPWYPFCICHHHQYPGMLFSLPLSLTQYTPEGSIMYKVGSPSVTAPKIVAHPKGRTLE